MENEIRENWYQVNLLKSSTLFEQEWSENPNNKNNPISISSKWIIKKKHRIINKYNKMHVMIWNKEERRENEPAKQIRWWTP